MKQALIILLLTIQFVAVGRTQQPAQKKPDTRGRIGAQSTVSQDLMPNLSTGEFTCDGAKKLLSDRFRQEVVICLQPEPSNFATGMIFDQYPHAGARLPPKTTITLHVSNGQPPVPPANPTGDNTNNDTTTPAQPSADVSVTQELAGAGPFRAGQSVHFTITVHNAGPADASNVLIVETPTNLKISEGTGDCKTFPCTIPNLPKDGNVTIPLIASIDREGPFQSRVEVSATPQDLKTSDNIQVTDGFADPIPATPPPTASPTPPLTPSPSVTPPPNPDPCVWLGVVLAVAGSGLVVSGTTAVHIVRKRRRLRLNGSQPSPHPPQHQPPPQPPPVPVVDPKVDLRSGESEIDRLQVTGPQIRLQTDLRLGGTTFDGPIPIVRKEVRNE